MSDGHFQRVGHHYQSQLSRYIILSRFYRRDFSTFPRCILRCSQMEVYDPGFYFNAAYETTVPGFRCGIARYHLRCRRYCRFSFTDMIEHVPPDRISALKGYQSRMLRPPAGNMIFIGFAAHQMCVKSLMS